MLDRTAAKSGTRKRIEMNGMVRVRQTFRIYSTISHRVGNFDFIAAMVQKCIRENKHGVLRELGLSGVQVLKHSLELGLVVLNNCFVLHRDHFKCRRILLYDCYNNGDKMGNREIKQKPS